mgnify:CR=1 FL=1
MVNMVRMKCKKCGCENFKRTEQLEVVAFYKINEDGELIRERQEITSHYSVPKENKLICTNCGAKVPERSYKE